MCLRQVAIADKFTALKRGITYIQRAGDDIEMGLDAQLKVINHQQLNIDKTGLRQVVDCVVEAGLLAGSIDVDIFTDLRFDVLVTIE